MAKASTDSNQFRHVFFPYAEKRTAAVTAIGGRFVYYTTAEVAFQILRKKEIWLRNALLMNDFSEIAHGFECLNAAYKGPAGDLLKAVLESCFPGLPQEIEDVFNNLLPNIRLDTYLTCLSEHCVDEDVRGRLSMWRAYGGSTGVALVINGGVMHATSDALGAYSSPVYYGNQAEFAEDFRRVVTGIAAEVSFLKTLDRETVRNAVFQMLRFAALCTKHPGFREELEWRVVASPTMYSPPRLTNSIEVVRGVPQRVLKIKLENAPEEGLTGLALPELLDRVIIGPCKFPHVTAMAFYQCLSEAGIPDPAQHIVVADIPLRHDG